MKLLIATIITALLFCTGTYSQTQVFDIVTYKAPKDWKEIKNAESITYLNEDPAKGFCMLTIYKSIDATNNAQENFSLAWQSLVKENLGVTADAEMQPASSENDWTSITGHAQFEKDNIKGAVILASSTRDGKLSNILILTSSAQYENEITAFTESVTFKKTGTPVASASISSGERADIWMNIQVNPTATNPYANIYTSATSAKFYVVYPNGDYYPEMPLNGLAGFSKASNNNDSWGKFTMQGKKGKFKSKYEDIAVEKLSATVMKKTGHTFNFYKCASVDGLKMEGGYSYIPNWTKDPYYIQAGCRQVIYFKKDGSFDDRGIFVSNCLRLTQNPENAPGKGTYTISNFTLALKYDDGRTIYKAFTGVADKNPAIDNEMIYIGANPFYKK